MCVCVCVCARAHVCTHKCMHVYVSVCMHTHNCHVVRTERSVGRVLSAAEAGGGDR